MKNLKKFCLSFLLVAFAFSGVEGFAEEAANLEDKLLPLVTMEQAFAKALQRRGLLVRFIEQENAKLKETEDEEEVQKIAQGLAQARNALAELTTYMDVIFGLGGNRSYEYDNVKSTIYLRVGTVTEVFARAVQARDSYAQRVLELKELIDKEEDETRKATLQREHDAAAQRWALLVNALYSIYQVHPKRNYQFNPENLTLYLKTSDEEIQKLNAEIEKLREEQNKTE